MTHWTEACSRRDQRANDLARQKREALEREIAERAAKVKAMKGPKPLQKRAGL